MDSKHGSVHPRTVFHGRKYFKEKLICSQEELHLAPRKIVKQTGSVDNQYGEW